MTAEEITQVEKSCIEKIKVIEKYLTNIKMAYAIEHSLYPIGSILEGDIYGYECQVELVDAYTSVPNVHEGYEGDVYLTYTVKVISCEENDDMVNNIFSCGESRLSKFKLVKTKCD